MAKQDFTFEDFLADVAPELKGFVKALNDYLLSNSCTVKIEQAKSGFVVSYNSAATKRVVLNFVFRKSGLIIRIYADFVQSYEAFLQTLPEGMKKTVDKAPICKRLSNTAPCNSRCSMGFDFTLEDSHYQKCRYSSFMFPVNRENVPFIQAFVEHEIRERQK